MMHEYYVNDMGIKFDQYVNNAILMFLNVSANSFSTCKLLPPDYELVDTSH